MTEIEGVPAPVVATDSLKLRLIRAARDLLERDGLEGLTLRAAARSCGVSHMAPYRHFEDKDELLAAVAEQGFRDLAASMNGIPDGDDLRLQIGIAYVTFALENPALYRLMFGPNLVPRERFPGLAAAGAEAFEGCIRASGEPADAESATAFALWAFVHGLADLAMDGLIRLPGSEIERTTAIRSLLGRFGR